MNLLIVESPSKAITINKYLSELKDKYIVKATCGHVCYLDTDSSAIEVDSKNIKFHWKIKSKKIWSEIEKYAKDADKVFIGVDCDREGVGIAQHIYTLLSKKISEDKIHRIVFHEVTKSSIIHAIENPTTIDEHLFNSFQARVAIDHTSGLGITPVLWRKFSLSTTTHSPIGIGRLKAAMLTFLCMSEIKYRQFIPTNYWTIHGQHTTINFELKTYNGDTLDKNIISEEMGNIIAKDLETVEFIITEIKKRKTNHEPPSPLSTSLMLQAANTLFHMTPDSTMQNAQYLYEHGFITYMRTENINTSEERSHKIREYIKTSFKKEYLSPKLKTYTKKKSSTQEPHEAICPTNIECTPEMIQSQVNSYQYKLYKVIWERSIMSQMASSISETLTIRGENTTHKNPKVKLTGNKTACSIGSSVSQMIFDGFKIFKHTVKDDQTIPKTSLKTNDKIYLKNIENTKHTTIAPSRYSPASIISELEKKGVGRPSTYVPTITGLEKFNYCTLNKSGPIDTTIKGILIDIFMKKYFEKYCNVEFTSIMEEKLDEIANNKINWKEVIQEFYKDLTKNMKEVNSLTSENIEKYINNEIYHLLVKTNFLKEDCSQCENGKLRICIRKKVFIGCSNYPNCTFISPIDGTNKSTEEIQLDNEKYIINSKSTYKWIEKDDKRIYIPSFIPNDLLTKNIMNNILNKDAIKIPGNTISIKFTKKCIVVVYPDEKVKYINNKKAISLLEDPAKYLENTKKIK